MELQRLRQTSTQAERLEEERELERLEEEEKRQNKLLFEEEEEKMRQEKELGIRPSNLTDQQKKVRQFLQQRFYKRNYRVARGADAEDRERQRIFRLEPLSAEEQQTRRRIKHRKLLRKLRTPEAKARTNRKSRHTRKLKKLGLYVKKKPGPRPKSVQDSSLDDDHDSELGDAHDLDDDADRSAVPADQPPGSATGSSAASSQPHLPAVPGPSVGTGSKPPRPARLASMEIGFVLNQE